MVKEMKKGEVFRIEWKEEYGTPGCTVELPHPYNRGEKIIYIIPDNILYHNEILRIRRNQDGSYTLWVGDRCPVKRKERYHILSVLDDMEDIPQEVIEKVERELYREWYAL